MKPAEDNVTPTPFGPERAEEIFAQRGLQHAIDHVMTAGERAYVVLVWDRMPGNTCFMDAFHRIRQGKVTDDGHLRDGAPALALVPPAEPERARPKRRPRRPAVYLPGTARVAPSPRRTRLAGAAEVFADAADIRAASQEVFLVWDLDVRHRVIERRTVAIGNLTGVEVHPREVFRAAILNNAAAIVCAHNHPSGEFSPSQQDLVLTRKLREVGELVGIALLDHVVVSVEGYCSLAERGWL